MAVSDIVVSQQKAAVIQNDGFPQTSVFAYVNVLGIDQLVGPSQNILGVFTLASSITNSISAPTVSEILAWKDCTGYALVKSGSSYKFQTTGSSPHDVYEDGTNTLVSDPNPANAYAFLAHCVHQGSVRNF